MWPCELWEIKKDALIPWNVEKHGEMMGLGSGFHCFDIEPEDRCKIKSARAVSNCRNNIFLRSTRYNNV